MDRTPITAQSSTPSPEVSYVVASYNSRSYLAACLDSLSNGGVESYEVIVVDNGSTDGTQEFITDRFVGVRLTANRTNVGHCKAINQGLRQARGEYIVVADGDTVLEKDATQRLLEFLRGTSDVAIVAPRMLNPDGSIQETARAFPALWNGIFGRQSLVTRLFPNNPFARKYLRKDAIRAVSPFEVDWVSAAFMAFHCSLPSRVGFWDEGYLGYWVDADWCKAAHAAGKIYCIPEARVVHYEQNRTGIKKGRNRITMFHGGAYRFYEKHCTFGPWDPRAILARAALAGRCALLICFDWFQPAGAPAESAPTILLRFTAGAQLSENFDARLQQEKE